jgi:hypothetical protein
VQYQTSERKNRIFRGRRIIQTKEHNAVPFGDEIGEIAKRRAAACERLEKALAHKTRLELLAIITGWMSVEDLEKLAEFQDRE